MEAYGGKQVYPSLNSSQLRRNLTEIEYAAYRIEGGHKLKFENSIREQKFISIYCPCIYQASMSSVPVLLYLYSGTRVFMSAWLSSDQSSQTAAHLVPSASPST